MAISVALTLQPGQAHTFNIHFTEEFLNVMEVVRLLDTDELKLLPMVVGGIPHTPGGMGEPGNISDQNNLTQIFASAAPFDFPSISVSGNQPVKRIEVVWRPQFAPIEYLIQGRDSLVGNWIDIPETHRPNVSALGTIDGVDEFDLSTPVNYKWYRVSTRMSNQAMMLVDVLMYGEGEDGSTQFKYKLASDLDVKVEQNGVGTLVKNVSGRAIELAVQHLR